MVRLNVGVPDIDELCLARRLMERDRVLRLRVDVRSLESVAVGVGVASLREMERCCDGDLVSAESETESVGVPGLRLRDGTESLVVTLGVPATLMECVRDRLCVASMVLVIESVRIEVGENVGVMETDDVAVYRVSCTLGLFEPVMVVLNDTLAVGPDFEGVIVSPLGDALTVLAGVGVRDAVAVFVAVGVFSRVKECDDDPCERESVRLTDGVPPVKELVRAPENDRVGVLCVNDAERD